jgi:hypothetical protein
MFPRATEIVFLGWFGLAFALSAAGIFSALAAPPNYFTRTWQVEQGLPQNKVTAVVQTRDGYLWVGTYNELAWFDGVRFTKTTRWNCTIAASRVCLNWPLQTTGAVLLSVKNSPVVQGRAVSGNGLENRKRRNPKCARRGDKGVFFVLIKALAGGKTGHQCCCF